MRKVTTKLYKFDELSDEAKETALNNNRYIETEHFEWWQFAYDDFRRIINKLNGDKVDKFYFNIDRGAFCSFEWRLTGEEFLNIIEREQDILSEYVDERFKEMFEGWKKAHKEVNRWVKYCVTKIGVDAYGSISHGNRGESTSWEYDAVDGKTWEENTNLEQGFEELALILEQVCKDLSNYFLQQLRNEYEYRISDECVKQALISNEYEFTVDGNSW